MGFAIFRPNESLDAVAEGEQAEEVALLRGRETKDERRVHITFDQRAAAALTRAQPRRIHDHVNFLGALDLKNFRNRPAALCRRFPVHVFRAVACDVFAQLFKIASLADLPETVNAQAALMKKKRRDLASFGAEIGIDADFAPDRESASSRPEPQTRRRFDDALF